MKLWDYYPRHENRQAAVRAWDKLRPSSELVDTMARSLKCLKSYWQDPEAPAPPHLSTWLNNARWTDVPYQRPAREVVDGGWLPDSEVM